ncbi:MAG: T9SS type A sorting domain-containing protein [Saprospiraceae bacterium]|nr:T9SS type A sorting domain-containing protein [Saprospiraceae bacterium]
MYKILSLVIILGLLPFFVLGQYCITTDKFTWEGDTIGNRAVWKADDVLNTYTIGSTQIKVSISDPFGVNTTTLNPSDQNDYTKSNAYYGPGSLMMQSTATVVNQPVCLTFEFSNPTILQNFPVFDIDYIARGRLESSYQDSLSFIASMNGRNVPLSLQYMSAFPTFNIMGQSVKSKYVLNTNGDVNHYDSRGAVIVSSNNVAVNSFTLCHVNGSQDDGVSNSHAVRLPGFEFCVTGLGSVSGKVKNNSGSQTYAGSVVQLFDTLGFPVKNFSGEPYIATTQADGLYYFDSIPFGVYDVIQLNDPTGSSSFDDADGGNDNKIRIILSVNNPDAVDRDFIEYFSPLPVRFGSLKTSWKSEHEVLLDWFTFSEVNNHFFTVFFSTNGTDFMEVGKIMASGSRNSEKQYSFVHQPGEGHTFYYKLSQTDFDGKFTDLATSIIRTSRPALDIRVFPNPGTDFISLSGLDEENKTTFVIYNTLGKMIDKGVIHHGNISIDHFPAGTYFIQLNDAQNQQVTLSFCKK